MHHPQEESGGQGIRNSSEPKIGGYQGSEAFFGESRCCELKLHGDLNGGGRYPNDDLENHRHPNNPKWNRCGPISQQGDREDARRQGRRDQKGDDARADKLVVTDKFVGANQAPTGIIHEALDEAGAVRIKDECEGEEEKPWGFHSRWVRYPEACFGLVGGTG